MNKVDSNKEKEIKEDSDDFDFSGDFAFEELEEFEEVSNDDFDFEEKKENLWRL